MYIGPCDDYKIEFNYPLKEAVRYVIDTKFEQLGHDVSIFSGVYPELKTYKEFIRQEIEVRSTAISYNLLEDIFGHTVDRKKPRINLNCEDMYKLYMWAIKGNIQYNQRLSMKTFYSFCLDRDNPYKYGFYPKELEATLKSFYYEDNIILCKKQSDKNVQWVIYLDKLDSRNTNKKAGQETHKSIIEYTNAIIKYISNMYLITKPKVKIYKKEGASILIYDNISREAFQQCKTVMRIKGLDTSGRYINLLPEYYSQLYG